MRVWMLASIALLPIAACGGNHNLEVDGPAVYPPAADLQRDIIDTTLAVDVGSHTGTATITLAPSPSTGASFEIGDLAIRAVRLGGGADGRALEYVDQGKQIDIGVPPSTEPLVIAIDYTYQLHGGSDGVSPTGYTLTWPYWCGNMFPCHSAPSDGTTFHLQVTGASSTVVYPMVIPTDAPSYQAAWIVGDYTKLELGTTTAGTHVVMWHKPNGAAAAQTGGAHLVAAFDWMEQHLGPYRFGGEVGTVAASWGAGAFGGMEHHPYWHVSTNAMSDEGTNVHESAHGWFGDGVRIRCWEDFVLSEGTVSYLEARVLEEAGATATSQAIWAGYEGEADAMRGGNGNGVAWPQSCGQVDILNDGLFSRVPYVKGALFYRAVEQKVGRAPLTDALHAFYMKWQGKAAGMQDMLDTIHEVTGYDATACAQAWLVDGATVPQYVPCP